MASKVVLGRVHDRPLFTIVGATVVYDAWLIRYRRDSLSRHFAVCARARPVALSAAVAYTLAHLYGALPVRVDGFLLAAKGLG